MTEDIDVLYCEWCDDPGATIETDIGYFCSPGCHNCRSVEIERENGGDYYIHYDDATEYDYITDDWRSEAMYEDYEPSPYDDTYSEE